MFATCSVKVWARLHSVTPFVRHVFSQWTSQPWIGLTHLVLVYIQTPRYKGPRHHGMEHLPRVADRGVGLQIWRVAANVLTNQSRTANNACSSRVGAGREANNSWLTPWCTIFFEKLIVTQFVRKTAEGSLQSSQKPATRPYSEPAESSSPRRSLSP